MFGSVEIMHGRFITPEETSWMEALRAVDHDIYHLPRYATLAARHAGGEATAFLVEYSGARLFVPLVRRPLPAALNAPADWSDVVSPYGYASPLYSGSTAPELATALWQAFRRSCREQSIIAAFLRCHPLLPLEQQTLGLEGLRCEGETVFIDLSLPDDEQWQQFRENHRRGIRRLRRDGYATRVDNWTDLDDFVRLYRETMLRAGADPFYLFPHSYFRELRDLDTDRVHLCTVLAPQGDIAAAGMFFVHEDMVQFHLSGTAADHLQASPTKLMFDDMRKWATGRCRRHFHLGGGVGCSDDSLFNFKAGFSRQRAVFHTARLICDAGRYRLLAGRAGVPDGEIDLTDGYFPSYRRITPIHDESGRVGAS